MLARMAPVYTGFVDCEISNIPYKTTEITTDIWMTNNSDLIF